MLLSPIHVFLERLSKEIESDNLASFKFLLQKDIPDGILEKCSTARELFSCMMKNRLLGEDNLEYLKELLSETRKDLLGRVEDFELQLKSRATAMVMVHFSFLGRSQDVNLQCTSDSLLSNMSRALCIGPEDLSCVQCQEDASCWFNITVQMPDKKELLDTLRYQAIGKAKWLQNCAVKAVRIGDEAQILLQPITSSTFMMTDSSTDDQRIHNDKKLDLIVAVDCATGNPVVLKRLRRQLISAINSVFEILKDLDFRLALISYQNHLDMTRHGQGAGFVHNTAILERFTSNKEEMKNNINSLRCMGRKGHQKGLADGLALAVHLSEGISTGDPQRCRKEAVKVCVLLPLEDCRGNLDIFRCNHGHDVTKLCDKLAENSVTLYTILGKGKKPGALVPGPAHQLMEAFYTGISLKTGGQFISTQNTKLISPIILHAVRGDISMERLFGTAYDIVFQEIKTQDGDVDLEKLTKKLKEGLNERYCRVNLLTANGAVIGPTSEPARKFSLDVGIDNACKTFRSELRRMAQYVENAPETPSDVNMEADSSQGSSSESEMTTDASERMLRKVVQRKKRY